MEHDGYVCELFTEYLSHCGVIFKKRGPDTVAAVHGRIALRGLIE